MRHYAEVHLLLEPGEPGSGLRFDAACSEDQLDRNWQRLILTHLAEKEHRGVLTGAPITDMRITLVAGRAHVKHTEGCLLYTSMDTAVELYGFCPDLDQNEDGSIGSLADALWQSSVWYFWWD